MPPSVISRYLCNGIDPMQVVQSVGFFGPLPVKVLKSGTTLNGSEIPCPVTYVVLTRDRVMPAATQRRMAGRIPNVDLVELESCHQVTLDKPRELADLLLSYS